MHVVAAVEDSVETVEAVAVVVEDLEEIVEDAEDPVEDLELLLLVEEVAVEHVVAVEVHAEVLALV